MLGDISKWPEGTMVVVPDGPKRHIKFGEQFINASGETTVWVSEHPTTCVHQPLRVLSPAQFAASLEPQLPAVGSVWRASGGEWLKVATNTNAPDWPGVSVWWFGSECEENWTAPEFAQWVSDNNAKIVFDPTKEPPCPSK